MDKKKTETKEPSSRVFYEATFKLFANPDIDPVVKFIAALSKPTESEEDQFRNKLFRFCVAKYPECLSLKLIRIYSSKEPRFSDDIRESAMRFLFVILIIDKASLTLATVQDLSTRLISCLEEEEISEYSFSILVGLVNRIASELFTVHKTTWHDLREFISSRAEKKFERAVYVFKKLSMPLNGDEFVIPIMEKLLPTILIHLKGEEKRSSHWCLAFVGGFCAVVHLLKATRFDLVENLAHEMLKSVKRGMELGFVDTALKEVEDVVEDQLCWYCTTELRFVLDLVRRINAVVTEKRTRNVLRRIEVVVKKKMLESGDADWLNQRR